MIPAADPQIRNGSPVEAKRLSKQCQAILAQFDYAGQSRASNLHLSTISLKYTSRISDLRRAGFLIVVIYRNHRSGLTIYEYQGWRCPACGATGLQTATHAVHICPAVAS